MITPPTNGFNNSRREHNIRLELFCDWLEASILFCDDSVISKSDVVGELIRNEVYDDQDFANNFVSDAWRTLKRRQIWLGHGCPFEVKQTLERKMTWQDAVAHSFLLMLSCSGWYQDWWKQFSNNYIEQGQLFEELTLEAVGKIFGDWETHLTGWSRTQSEPLEAIVKKVSSLLGEQPLPLEPWTVSEAKDEGLDILLFHDFADQRAGRSIYLMQCASGQNWNQKLHTPRLQIWKKIINFSSPPSKAFAMPHALSDSEFKRNANLVEGMLLDRYRILAPARTEAKWVSEELEAKLLIWLQPRIEKLVTYEPV